MQGIRVSHLGERLTALVDGELGHAERDRALAHLAACEQCRAEAEALRRLKSQLRALREAVPEPGLLRRLGAMGDIDRPGLLRDTGPGLLPDTGSPGLVPDTERPGVLRGPSGVTPMGTGSQVALFRSPAAPRRRTRRPGRRAPMGGARRGPAAAASREVPRGRYLIAGAATLAVLGVGAVSFAAGGQPQRLPPVAPALEQFAIEHALTSGDVSIADPSVLQDSPAGP
jgi:hypothetical protein